MSKFGQSINDLIGKGGNIDNESAVSKFQSKMKSIKLAELESKAQFKAQSLNLPYINLDKFPISPEAISLIPKEEALKNKIVCFYRTFKEARFGVIDPTNEEIQDIAYAAKENEHLDTISFYVISKHSYDLAVKYYDYLPKIIKTVQGVEITKEDLEKFASEVLVIKDLQNKIEKVNISEKVNALVSLALQINASDIHIEAEEKTIIIRYRVDGILNEAAELDKKIWPRISSRIKLLAGLKLNVENKPQDGRFTIFLEDNEKVDVRTSFIPTTYGESIVMRLLKSSATGLKFEDLGILGNSYEHLKEQIKKPNGMIITTGPTGSGKTTTLYSILNKLNTEETKIITLEDPVEYKLKGINQSQIDHSKGYNFAKGLRSILRQDPDIVMVGEIRDLETAEVAINASLTGHLVISTLHTNSAAAALPRFISMGVKGFLLSPALNAIIGQRLVRRICEHCKKEIKMDNDTKHEIKTQLEKLPPNTLAAQDIDINNIDNFSVYKGEGCPECHGIGYKGRIGIYEVLIMNKEIEEKILDEKVSEYDIEKIALEDGMVTMVQDGLFKVLKGITTVEEVFRVAKTLE